MPEEKMLRGLGEEICGLKDPGTALIIVYISIVLFLLLFAGLESARADFGGIENQTVTLNDVHRGELLVPTREEGRYTVAPLLARNVKISMSGGTTKIATPSELFMVLGLILVLLALLLAKDGTGR